MNRYVQSSTYLSNDFMNRANPRNWVRISLIGNLLDDAMLMQGARATSGTSQVRMTTAQTGILEAALSRPLK
jgi:hypothetical protein